METLGIDPRYEEIDVLMDKLNISAYEARQLAGLPDEFESPIDDMVSHAQLTRASGRIACGDCFRPACNGRH